jgi:hypothetical protein
MTMIRMVALMTACDILDFCDIRFLSDAHDDSDFCELHDDFDDRDFCDFLDIFDFLMAFYMKSVSGKIFFYFHNQLHA